MARLFELTPYLEKGYSLQCVTGTRLIPEMWGCHVVVFSHRKATKERVHRETQLSLAEIRGMNMIWEYGVLFLNSLGQEYRIDSLAEIETAIQNNTPHRSWGQLPPIAVSHKRPGPSEVK